MAAVFADSSTMTLLLLFLFFWPIQSLQWDYSVVRDTGKYYSISYSFLVEIANDLDASRQALPGEGLLQLWSKFTRLPRDGLEAEELFLR